ncbi:hypothetical protein AWB69_00022 [Caballeronia udeis]|uniref:Lipoprotein n=1 Tax=Caballeronia udeis TaxID=1232866 RepID=A0A158EP36_9BURK|nr:hypothetical protein [Caballeronia udeis]SAL09325.1 hypothetical protein AWB69_00022 [Caballeronia udeis]
MSKLKAVPGIILMAKCSSVMAAVNGFKNLFKSQSTTNPGPTLTSDTHSDNPTKNAQGWILHRDKDGNLAYVSPDRRQFEEVH